MTTRTTLPHFIRFSLRPQVSVAHNCLVLRLKISAKFFASLKFQAEELTLGRRLLNGRERLFFEKRDGDYFVASVAMREHSVVIFAGELGVVVREVRVAVREVRVGGSA